MTCWTVSSAASSAGPGDRARRRRARRPTGTCCSRGRRAPARARCCAPSPTSSASGFEFVEGNAELTPARLVGHFDPARVLTDGYDPDVFVDGPLVSAMRDGSLLYVEEINRIPEETLNVLITVMSERELHVPRLGRVPATDGFRLVAAMNPFDAIGTARISSAVYDRVCRLPSATRPPATRRRSSSPPASTGDDLDAEWLAKVVRGRPPHARAPRGAHRLVRARRDRHRRRGPLAGQPARLPVRRLARSASTPRSSRSPVACACARAARASRRTSSPRSGSACSGATTRGRPGKSGSPGGGRTRPDAADAGGQGRRRRRPGRRRRPEAHAVAT